MGLTVRAMCKIIHELWPETIIGVQGLVDGNPCDSIALYVYPDDDSYWGEQEVSRVDIGRDDRLKIVSVTLSVDIDSSIVIDRIKRKKGEKMSKDKEPVKLSSILDLFDDDEGANISIKLKTGKYVHLHGEIGTLRELDIIQGCFVVGMGTEDPDTEEEILYILVEKQ